MSNLISENLKSYTLNSLSKEFHLSCSTCRKILEDIGIYKNNSSKKFSQEDALLVKEFLLLHPNTRKYFLKKTNMERYGVENPFQSEEIKNKIKQTCKQKYGVDYYSQSEDHHNKFVETSLRKYNTENPFQNEEVKEKIKETNIKKYGVTHPSLLNEFKEKASKTSLEKYGVDNPSKSSEVKKKIQESKNKTISENEKNYNCTLVESLIKSYGQGWRVYLPGLEEIKIKGRIYIPNKEIPKIEKYCKEKEDYGRSRSENEVLEFIKSIYDGDIIINDRDIISPLELDIYIPEKKIAVEYNGNYWHSFEVRGNKHLHENKSKLCEKLGIRLIHIYECEWEYSKEKIKSLLRLSLGIGYSRIGARECEVKIISNKEAKDFNNLNHLQNHRNAQVTYGLFYKGKLVQLMSFSHHRKYQWEIIRGCPGSNNQVVGGVSKLFSRFIKDYNPKSVFSYCDFNKFDGKSYEALGMKFIGHTGPDKFYVDKTGYKIMRNPKKRYELEENCRYTIFGAGSKKYLYEKG